jgi:hypothetical protein
MRNPELFLDFRAAAATNPAWRGPVENVLRATFVARRFSDLAEELVDEEFKAAFIRDALRFMSSASVEQVEGISLTGVYRAL